MKRVEIVKMVRVMWPRGAGTEDDPCRTVPQYYDFDGNLIWENDQWAVNNEAILVSGTVPNDCPGRDKLVEKIQRIGAGVNVEWV